MHDGTVSIFRGADGWRWHFAHAGNVLLQSLRARTTYYAAVADAVSTVMAETTYRIQQSREGWYYGISAHARTTDEHPTRDEALSVASDVFGCAWRASLQEDEQ